MEWSDRRIECERRPLRVHVAEDGLVRYVTHAVRAYAGFVGIVKSARGQHGLYSRTDRIVAPSSKDGVCTFTAPGMDSPGM